MAYRRIGLLAAVVLALLGNHLFWSLTNQPVEVGPDVPGGTLRSVSFSPFRDGQSPWNGDHPTPLQIERDIALLAGKVRSIRVYTCLTGMEVIPEIARRHGIKVTMGAWLDFRMEANRAEIDTLIRLANEYPDVIERVIVGNEVMLRYDMPPEQLLKYIREVKAKVSQPVSYGDVRFALVKYPEVARELDFITVHILPFWEAVTIDAAERHIHEVVDQMTAAFPGKPLLIGEIGWPNAGRQRGPAVASAVTAARFTRTVVAVAQQSGFDYNIVEAFDQPWKSLLEGTVGGKWGLWSNAREPVFPLTGPVVETPDWPWRFALSSLLMIALIAPVARRLHGAGGLVTVVMAQGLAVALLQYGIAAQTWGISFWRKFSFGPVPDALALMFGVVLAALAIGAVMRAADILDGRSSPRLSLWLPGLLRLLCLVAILMGVMIVVDGRYRDIPLPQFAVPVVAVLGIGLVRVMLGHGARSAFSLRGGFGGEPQRWLTLALAVALPLLALAHPIAEAVAIAGDYFTDDQAGLGERLRLTAFVLTSNGSVLLWSAMLLVLAAPHLAEVLPARRRLTPFPRS